MVLVVAMGSVSDVIVDVAVADAVGAVVSVTGVSTRALRCASVLKPIYAWVTRHASWAEVAEAMIARSDNDATDVLVTSAGGVDELCGRIEGATGVTVKAASTWGRFEVTAVDVAAMFAALAAAARSKDPVAAAVVRMMGGVHPAQSFGVRAQWARSQGLPVDVVGAKAGWDLSVDEAWLRTHTVVVSPVGLAVTLTAVPVDETLRVVWERTLARRGSVGVLPIHVVVAGDFVLGGMSLAAGHVTRTVVA